MQEQTNQTQTAAGETPVPLQLNDLYVCAQAIQLASTRGAFRAEEFTQVGSAFERIVAFLKASGAIAPTGETAEKETAE
jgi:hypothetical protein